MHVTAIIAAGGRGHRFGGALPKQLLMVAGRAVLERSVAAFASHAAIAEVVVALPPELAANPPVYLRERARSDKPVRIVAGGARRQDSVANAFQTVGADTDVVVIHDAARPFATADLISRTIAAAAESGAAIAAVQSRDTVKLAGATGQGASDEARLPFVLGTLPRDTIYLAQTPQAFRRGVLRDALALADSAGTATDEASLAERAGHPVRLVAGELSNIKITTPDDLAMAEAIARGARAPEERGRSGGGFRVGTGYDLHCLVEGRPLILGGVTIPFARGLAGHSDGDAVCHAITDAILGAAAAGNIGTHFSDSDPQWKGASSLDLLRHAAAVVRERGFDVANVDASVVAERPKLSPHIDAMCAAVADAIGVGAAQVSIKGRTNEGVDAVGRGDAIAVHAVALLGPLRD